MSLARRNKDEDRHPRTTLAAVESLALPLVQQVVFLADFGCPRCQQRVAEIMSKMKGNLVRESQSLVISIVEKKKVTLTCGIPHSDKQVQRSYWRKVSLIARLFRSQCI